MDLINGTSTAAGDTAPVCYMRYKLERSFVKSWSLSGDADIVLAEAVTFGF